MPEIISTHQPIDGDIEKAFHFFSDFRNFQSLLPIDAIENFVSEKDFCAFNIKGVAKLEVRIAEKIEYKKITYESRNISSFPIQLHLLLTTIGSKPHVKLDLYTGAGKIVWMMAEKPLNQLLIKMNEKLIETCNTLK